MTSAAAILDRLNQLGVVAMVEADALRLRPASVIPADLLTDLRRYKVEVLALLTAAANDPLPVPLAEVDSDNKALFIPYPMGVADDAWLPHTILPIPTEAAALLAHLRDELHCRVTREGDRLMIRPAHRCPPRTLAAVLAVQAEVEALVAAPPVAAVTAPTDADVEAVAGTMMRNPAHTIIDPDKALAYCRANALTRLTAATDPLAC